MELNSSTTGRKVTTAAVLVIADEVLEGRIADTNSHFLAKELWEKGIRLREIRVIPDIVCDIVAAVRLLRSRYDYLFTTGGLGPTHDDVTSEALAEAFDRPLRQHPDAVRQIADYYKCAPESLSEARLRMADVPLGATLIPNSSTGAPGYRIENVIAMAGIPVALKAMWDVVAPTLTHGIPMQRVVLTTNLGETTIANRLNALARRFSAVAIGSYPQAKPDTTGRRTVLVIRSAHTPTLCSAVGAIRNLIEGDLKGLCWQTETEPGMPSGGLAQYMN